MACLQARQRSLGRIVALKMILAGPSGRRNWTASAASQAWRVQHPNIVQIYEVGEQEAARISRWNCSTRS